MARTENVRQLANFIWSVADLLRGDYKQSDYGAEKEVVVSKIFDNADFGYWRITVERPLRLNFQQQVIPGHFTAGDYYISPEKFLEMQRYLVHPKDVLITVRGTIGRVAVVPEEIEPGIIDPRLVKYVVRQQVILPHFFAWVFRSKAGEAQLSKMAQDVTMDGLNLTVLSDLWMPVPPLEEQNYIVTHIHEIANKNDQLQCLVRKQIEKLQEYRRSLITAAVTGKLEITQEATS
jgi:type I restriction enzyme, S subunit